MLISPIAPKTAFAVDAAVDACAIAFFAVLFKSKWYMVEPFDAVDELTEIQLSTAAATCSREAAIAASTVFLPVPPILVIVNLPFVPTVAFPPKMSLTLEATLPNTILVECNCDPLMASVESAAIVPAATLIILRCALLAFEPTLTKLPVLFTVPAKLP